MTRALSLVLVWLTALAAAATPDGQPPRAELPESSRWLSFVRLVEARWDVRTRVPPEDADTRRALYDRCTLDAWHLSRPALLSPGAPCRRLLGDLKPSARKTAAVTRRAAGGGPDEHGYRRCVARAEQERQPALLDHCVTALAQGHDALKALDDEGRFQRWFKGCKKAILDDADPPDPLQEAHARHCLRTLPTFYEVRWMKKLSEYWTPDEQKRLYLRARQLGGD